MSNKLEIQYVKDGEKWETAHIQDLVIETEQYADQIDHTSPMGMRQSRVGRALVHISYTLTAETRPLDYIIFFLACATIRVKCDGYLTEVVQKSLPLNSSSCVGNEIDITHTFEAKKIVEIHGTARHPRTTFCPEEE